MSNANKTELPSMPIPTLDEIEANLAELRAQGGTVELRLTVVTPDGTTGHGIRLSPGTDPGPLGGGHGTYIAIVGDNEIETEGYGLLAALASSVMISMATLIRASETADHARQIAGPGSPIAILNDGDALVHQRCTKGSQAAGAAILDAMEAADARRAAGKDGAR